MEVIQQLSAKLEIGPGTDWAAWMQELAAAINRMIQTDFSRLVQLLYRMDVSEARLRQLLAAEPDRDAGVLIAGLMVERELQKIRTRRQFKAPNDIPDDEKW